MKVFLKQLISVRVTLDQKMTLDTLSEFHLGYSVRISVRVLCQNFSQGTLSEFSFRILCQNFSQDTLSEFQLGYSVRISVRILCQNFSQDTLSELFHLGYSVRISVRILRQNLSQDTLPEYHSRNLQLSDEEGGSGSNECQGLKVVIDILTEYPQ